MGAPAVVQEGAEDDEEHEDEHSEDGRVEGGDEPLREEGSQSGRVRRRCGGCGGRSLRRCSGR